LFAKDALHRESCGGHFREEYQTQREKGCVTMKTLLMLPLGNTQGKPMFTQRAISL
jgi:hypothetical protein